MLRDILFAQAGGERRLFRSCCWAFIKKKWVEEKKRIKMHDPLELL